MVTYLLKKMIAEIYTNVGEFITKSLFFFFEFKFLLFPFHVSFLLLKCRIIIWWNLKLRNKMTTLFVSFSLHSFEITRWVSTFKNRIKFGSPLHLVIISSLEDRRLFTYLSMLINFEFFGRSNELFKRGL